MVLFHSFLLTPHTIFFLLIFLNSIWPSRHVLITHSPIQWSIVCNQNGEGAKCAMEKSVVVSRNFITNGQVPFHIVKSHPRSKLIRFTWEITCLTWQNIKSNPPKSFRERLHKNCRLRRNILLYWHWARKSLHDGTLFAFLHWSVVKRWLFRDIWHKFSTTFFPLILLWDFLINQKYWNFMRQVAFFLKCDLLLLHTHDCLSKDTFYWSQILFNLPNNCLGNYTWNISPVNFMKSTCFSLYSH